MSTKKKSSNPLYVVTNDGQDVEQAAGFLDALIKRFGLEPALEILDTMLEMVISYANNYAAFLVLKEFVDQIVEALGKIREKLEPYASMLPF